MIYNGARNACIIFGTCGIYVIVMLLDLTERQVKILKAIIEEYTKTASAVGSETLADQYEINVSPATLRNEMADLVELGYLIKEHVSAGRIPGPQAYRLYIREMMDEVEIPVVSEVTIKQRIWEERHDVDRLLRRMVHVLADESKNLAFVITHDGRVYHAGSVHVLRHPEFYNIDLTRTVLHLMDQTEALASLFEGVLPEQELGVLLAEELRLSGLSQCGLVYARFTLPHGGYAQLGIIGPMRLNYPRIVPIVRYFKQVLDELSRVW